MELKVFLSEFKGGQTTKYAIPHRYRIAKIHQPEMADDLLSLWNRVEGKNILKELADNVSALEFDAFAVAPSHTEPFNRHLRNEMRERFSDKIDLSEFFQKAETFKAITITNEMTDDELQDNIYLSESSDDMPEGIDSILLVDDIYSKGSTFRAMELALQEKYSTAYIIGAVILKTT